MCFIGRGSDYTTSLEASLKLKEISISTRRRTPAAS